MAENKHVPSDLHALILQKLPSKSLLKFLTVSKSWYSLIKSPKFIASHLHHHKSLSRHPNNQLPLFRYDKPSITYYLYRHDNLILCRSKLPNPPPGCVVASYDGLLCLCDFMDKVTLWNPSIDKSRCIGLMPNKCSYICIFGFGYNSLHDNYKLVLINFKGLISDNHVCAQVYSFNQKGEDASFGWDEVSFPEYLFGINLSRISDCCFVNDMIHWIFFRYMYDDEFGYVEDHGLIMTFDPKSDCFGKIKLPTVISEAVDPILELAVIDDSLAVVQLLDFEESGLMDGAVVWRMEEYGVEKSWKVLYRIKLCSATNKEVWVKEKENENENENVIITSSGTMIVINVNSRSNSGVFDGARGMTDRKVYGCTESLLMLD